MLYTSPLAARYLLGVARAESEFFGRRGRPTTFFLKKGTTKVAATVKYVETATGRYKAIMTPASPLRSGVTYTAAVTTAAKDLAGNTLAIAKTWTFTVK